MQNKNVAGSQIRPSGFDTVFRCSVPDDAQFGIFVLPEYILFHMFAVRLVEKHFHSQRKLFRLRIVDVFFHISPEFFFLATM